MQDPREAGRQPIDSGKDHRMYRGTKVVSPLLRRALLAVVHSMLGRLLTQVIHAPLSAPNAISHAGSSDWKNSSG